MTAALDYLNTQAVNWNEPAGIQHLPAFAQRSHVGNGSIEPGPGTDIYPSWYKPRGASSESSVLDKVSNKLATNCTPDLAKQTASGDSNAERFSVDIFTGAAAAAAGNTSQNDDVHSCSDVRPSITLTVSDNGNGTYTLTATASQGTHPLNDPQRTQFPGTINFLVNGQVVQAVTFGDTSVTTQSFTYTPTSGGNATVTAQVIDSVLYDTTSEAQTVNFTMAPTGPTITSAVAAEATTTISWTGGSPNYTVYRNNGTPLGGNCSNTSGSSCTVSKFPNAQPGTQVYVVDGNGNPSANFTITGF